MVQIVLFGVFLFAVLEAAMYLLPAKEFQRMYMYKMFGPGTFNPYSLNPGAKTIHATDEFSVTMKVNDQGLRDVPHTYQKEEGIYRILTVGDSFTLGHGVELEEIYMKQLEKMLNQRRWDKVKKVEVVNGGGASGYSQDTQYLFVKNEGLKYHPDMVIVGLFAYNDVVEIEVSSNWEKQKDGLPEKISTEHYYLVSRKYTPVRKFLYKVISYSRLLTKVNDIVATFRYRFVIPPDRKKELDPTQKQDYDGFGFFREKMSLSTQEGFEKWKRVIQGLKKLCDSNGVELVVMLIPMDMQIYFEEGYKTLSPQLQSTITPEMMKADWSQKRLTGFMKNQSIPYVDLLPVFRERSNEYKGTEVYFNYDKHWRPLGHRIAAESLFNFVSPRIDEKNKGMK